MQLTEILFVLNNGTALLRKLRYSILANPLLYIHKAILRSHLYYSDFIYDMPHDEKFIDNLESIQYNATVARTGTSKGKSKEKLHNGCGLS